LSSSTSSLGKEDIMQSRQTIAREVRREAAEIAFLRPHPAHPANGEESDYSNPPPPPGPGPLPSTLNYIGNFSKGLPHNNLGTEVDPAAYRALVGALTSGNASDFEHIPLGTPLAG